MGWRITAATSHWQGLQAQSRRLIEIGQSHGALGAFKAMSGWLGVDCGPCRLPLRGLDAAAEAALRKAVEAEGLLDLLLAAER